MSFGRARCPQQSQQCLANDAPSGTDTDTNVVSLKGTELLFPLTCPTPSLTLAFLLAGLPTPASVCRQPSPKLCRLLFLFHPSLPRSPPNAFLSVVLSS